MTPPASIGRYTVLGEIGRGGMGTVFLAIDPSIDRRVAIKLLRRDVVTENPEVLERLWVEARAANRIGHPGVVQVSEVATLDDGTGYLVMEYLEGQTLSQKLGQRGGRMPVHEAIKYAVQVASTLNAGHQKGIVHRDLKPSNVMLVPDDAVLGGERIKLLDFGIAKIARLGAIEAGLTLANASMGTPGYMAPEQLRDAASANDRSDVYALAALLYEMLCGRPPHVAQNTADLMVAVLGEDAPPITLFEPSTPPSVEALLRRMLLRSPASERPTMTEVLREFVLMAASLPAQARPSDKDSAETPATSLNLKISASEAVASAATPSQLAGQRAHKEAPARAGLPRRWLERAAYAVIPIAVLSLAIWWGRHRNSSQRPAPPPIATPRLATPEAQPPAVPPVQPPPPPPTPSPPPAPVIMTPPPTKNPPLSPRPLALVQLTQLCLRPSTLPLPIKQAVANAAHSAGVRVPAEQAIFLQRQGERSFVFAGSHIPSLSARARDDFETILRGQLKSVSVPIGLKGIGIQCSR